VAGLQGNAERSWLDLMVPPETGRAFTREGIRRELERVRTDAAGPTPSPLERVLADRVALCWIAAMHADTQYAQRLADGMTWADSEYHQRRCERAQRQLLKAVQTLATVRRLLTPAVQLNVAENQITWRGRPHWACFASARSPRYFPAINVHEFQTTWGASKPTELASFRPMDCVSRAGAERRRRHWSPDGSAAPESARHHDRVTCRPLARAGANRGRRGGSLHTHTLTHLLLTSPPHPPLTLSRPCFGTVERAIRHGHRVADRNAHDARNTQRGRLAADRCDAFGFAAAGPTSVRGVPTRVSQ